jgi:hypothetical protein
MQGKPLHRVFPTDMNLPTASSRKNQVRCAVRFQAMQKAKKAKRKKACFTEDMSDDEVINRLVTTIPYIVDSPQHQTTLSSAAGGRTTRNFIPIS